jgi:glycosyltransferase involved in cell wall biosynthesis
MKIKGIARQREGGGYYRVGLPFEELERHGHETDWELATLGASADGADVVVGQLIGGSDRGITQAWWRDMYRQAALVYELDDDPFEMERINPVHHFYTDPLAQDSISECMRIANLVTVSTDVLAERMSKINPNVVVLKNRIDESMLEIERPQRDRLTIGWAGGDSHLRDIDSVAYGLKRVMDWNKDIDVHFVGADMRFLIKSPRPIRHTEWAVKTTDYYNLIDFDIGIAPLVSTVFAETKSHIKALEYSALGIPVVASDAAPYRDFVIDGVTGFLVKHDHEWARRLGDLINDDAMRTEMGAKARELASQWTIQKGWQEWESAYKGIVHGPA